MGMCMYVHYKDIYESENKYEYFFKRNIILDKTTQVWICVCMYTLRVYMRVTISMNFFNMNVGGGMHLIAAARLMDILELLN